MPNTKMSEAMDDSSILLYSVQQWHSAMTKMKALSRRAAAQIADSGGVRVDRRLYSGMANFSSRDQIFDAVYASVSTDNEGNWPKTRTTVPEGILHIPEFYPVLKTSIRSSTSTTTCLGVHRNRINRDRYRPRAGCA